MALLNSNSNLEAVAKIATATEIYPDDATVSTQTTPVATPVATQVTPTTISAPVNSATPSTSVEAAVQKILDSAPKNERLTQEQDADTRSNSQTEGEQNEQATNSEKETELEEEQAKHSDEEGETLNVDESPEEVKDRLRKEQEARAQAEADSRLTQEERDAKLPFHKHPRFQELTTQNRALRERQQALDHDIAWRKANAVTPELYAQAMNLAALSQKDPQEFYKVVDAMRTEYEIQQGIRLPQDLQVKVDNGKMDLQDAQEVAKLRVKTLGLERTNLGTAQQQEQARVNDITNALNTIGYELQKRDSGFRAKNPNDPNAVDGVWEFAFNAYALLQAKQPPRTGLEAQQQFQQCYNQVKRSFAALVPRKAVKTPFNAGRASGFTPSSLRREPKSVDDAVNNVLKRHGVTLNHNGD